MQKLVGIVCLLALICSAYSQTCMKSCDAGLSTCSQLDYNVYVANISTTLGTEVYAHDYFVKNVGSPVLGATCSAFMKNFMCHIFHPSCNGTTATPVKPCISFCYELLTTCGFFAQFMPLHMQIYFNCKDGGIDFSGNKIYADPTDPHCSKSMNFTSACPPKPPATLDYGGSCQPFNDVTRNLNLTTAAYYCGAFVPKNIWVPADWPKAQALLNAVFLLGGYVDRFNLSYGTMPVDCFTHLSSLICGSYFRPCITVDIPQYNTTAVVDQFPCRSTCEIAIDKCWDFLTSVNLTYALKNCTTSFPAPNAQGIVPVIVGNAQNVASSCRTRVFPEDPYAPFIMPPLEACPKAFGIREDAPDSESRCGLSCPDSSYTTEEWHDLVIVTRVGASLSLITMVFLVVSYMLQYEKRKFPSAIHFWEFVATLGFAISFLINGKNPEKDVWCKDPGTSATQGNNSACAAQGFLFIFFGLALAAWCLVISFIIFYGVVQNKKVNNLKKYTNAFHAFSWGGPLIFAVAAIASNSIGYGPPLAWCFIHFEGFGYGVDGVSRDYPLFYIPMLVLFVVVLVLFIATVTKIIWVRKMGLEHGNKSKSSRTFQAQVRVLIFILVVFVICFSIFEWRFEIEGEKANQKVGVAWAYCKMQVALGIEKNTALCPGETNPARIQYSRTVGESFVLSGIGLLIFVAFGADIGIYKHWAKIFKLAFTGEWKLLKDLVRFGKDPFATSSTQKSKSNDGSKDGTSNSNNTTGSKEMHDMDSKSSKNSNKGTSGDSSRLYNDEVDFSMSTMSVGDQNNAV